MRDPSMPYLLAAFLTVWVLLGAYLVRLWLMEQRLSERLRRLERAPGAEADDNTG